MESLKVLAPAKVNLFLGIGEQQADGYHQLTSVFHALALHDMLSFTALPEGAFAKGLVREEGGFDLETLEEGGLSVGVETLWREGMQAEDIPLKDNLVTKAVFGLARACDFPWKGYLRVSVEKHIPSKAGLAGGSSDAAAALLGCAALWGIDAQDARLQAVAQQLGADVAFFLRGACGLYEGRGDIFEHAIEPRRDSVLLVLPEGSVSTAEAYSRFDLNPRAIPEDLLARARSAKMAEEVPLFNNLASASERILADLSLVRGWTESQAGITEALLCGSGSATFCVCKDPETALKLAVEARAEGWNTRVTSFSSLRATVMPQQDRSTNIGATRV